MQRRLSYCIACAVGTAFVGLGAAVASASAGDSTASVPPISTAGKPAPEPLRVSAVLPRKRSAAAGDLTLTVRFSAPLDTSQRVAPKLVPALAGRWRQTAPNTLRFTPSSAYLPGQMVRLIVPAGIRAADGAVLKHAVRIGYRVGQPSSVRLVQLLADLRYLPVRFYSSRQPRFVNAAGQLRALYSPPRGRLVFGHGWPASLHELWAHDRPLVIRGALMAFESERGLAMDGIAGTQVWSALLHSVHSWQVNRGGYTYAVASEGGPETLTVYHNGSVVVHTLANTGIGVAPTAPGTFPVYERLRSQVMQGTNPDGSHYADYVQWVAYFNGGDAVHYMPRSAYGYPQSLGCIELPYSAAAEAWGYLTYGSLVTVTG